MASRERGRIRRMRVIVLATVVLGALAAAACSSPSSDPAPTLRLRFGVLLSVDQLPYFVMRAKGFDVDHGLVITETVAQGGTGILKAMAAGTLDLGYPGSVPLLNASRDGLVPDKAVAVGSVAFADADHRAFAVLVGKDVSGWADLEGQDVAVNQPGTIGDAALRSRLQQEGVRRTRLVSVPFPNQGLAVAGGNVAAAAMVEPFVTQSLVRGDGRVLDWVVGGGEPFPAFEESVIAVSTSFAREHPATVRAFLQAHLDAVRWINEHEREARDLLSSRLDLSQEVGRKMHLVRFASDARHDLTLLEQTRAVLVSLSPTPAPAPVARLLDDSFLREVLSKRGTG